MNSGIPVVTDGSPRPWRTLAMPRMSRRTQPTVAVPSNLASCPNCGFQKTSGEAACRQCGHHVPHASAGVWRNGKTVIALRDATLPSRCIRCGDVCSSPPLTRSVRWMNQTKLVILLVILGLFVVFVFPFMKKIDMTAHLCDRHLEEREKATRAGLNLSIVGVALILLAIVFASAWLGVLAGLALIAAAIWATAGRRFVAPKHVDDGFIHLRGADRRFLDTLPDWPGHQALAAAAAAAQSA